MYREEIITGKIVRVSPRGIWLKDTPIPRFFRFPHALRFVDEILKPGMIVSFVYVKTPASVIYETAGDPQVCKFYIKEMLKIKQEE